MKILALPSASSASLRFLADPRTVQAILCHLDLPHRPLPPALALRDGVSPHGFVFDQSLPDEFED